MTEPVIQILAGRLHGYLAERAKREGVPMELDERFVEGALRLDVVQMFGILWDEAGELVADEQEPEPGFLASWKRLSTRY